VIVAWVAKTVFIRLWVVRIRQRFAQGLTNAVSAVRANSMRPAPDIRTSAALREPEEPHRPSYLDSVPLTVRGRLLKVRVQLGGSHGEAHGLATNWPSQTITNPAKIRKKQGQSRATVCCYVCVVHPCSRSMYPGPPFPFQVSKR